MDTNVSKTLCGVIQNLQFFFRIEVWICNTLFALFSKISLGCNTFSAYFFKKSEWTPRKRKSRIGRGKDVSEAILHHLPIRNPCLLRGRSRISPCVEGRSPSILNRLVVAPSYSFTRHTIQTYLSEKLHSILTENPI